MSFSFAGKKLLIAGGTGFIGKRVTEYLSNNGATVFVISRKPQSDTSNVKYLLADLNDINSLKKFTEDSFDACIYMAAYIPEVGQRKESYYDAKKSTLDPLVNFCECFSNRVKQFVYISSIDVLGQCTAVNYDEEINPNIATPYGLAKYCGEFYVKDYCEQNNIIWQSLRFSQVYGPNEPIVRIIPIMKKALISNNPFTLYSDGQEKRRFLYIDDAVQAICCALSSEKKGIYNIAGKNACSMVELAHIFEKVYNIKLELSILNKTKGYDNIPSITKAENELGYFPKYSINEGLIKVREEESK